MTQPPTTTLRIDLSGTPPAPSYDILIQAGLLDEAGALIAARLGQRQCLIVSDSHVAPLYALRCEQALRGAGHTVLPTMMMTAGEEHKNFSTLQNIITHALEHGADRKSLIIALGGGVVGDLAGVAAALIMRGIDVVQIPTTLLAQVDSSVGGKTGIDTAWGKNTVGAFHQPRLVLADSNLLDSLPMRERRAGYAEVVKYGLIRDEKFFSWCVAHGHAVITGDSAATREAVAVSCRHKADIVSADEKETGERALLNLGHTFGHALETALGYSHALLHGEAVAIGCVMAFAFSVAQGFCPAEEAERVRRHFHDIGLPIRPPQHSYDIPQLINLMAQDKKAESGKITLILTRGIGQAFVQKDVSVNAVTKIWEEFLGV